MLKEIFEQNEALRQCLRGRLRHDEGLASRRIGDVAKGHIGHLKGHFLGMWNVLSSSLIGALALEKLARIPAKAEIASEFRHRNPVIDQATLFFAVTQSGETSDTLGAIKEIKLRRANCRYRKCCWFQYRTRVWSRCLYSLRSRDGCRLYQSIFQYVNTRCISSHYKQLRPNC